MAFHKLDFWEDRYSEHRELFDWYMQLPHFQSLILPYLKPESQILILGAGTSRLPYQLYDLGFKNITVVEFSEEARKNVESVLAQKPEIVYETNNIISFKTDRKFDFIVDKGCIDCVISDPEDPIGVLEQVLRNIKKLLKPDGKLFTITFDMERDEMMEEAGEDLVVDRQDNIKVQLVDEGAREIFYLYHVKFQ